MSPDPSRGYWCSVHKTFVPPDEWLAHLRADEPNSERLLVRLIRDLIESGDAIRCYPSGAVGFDDWNDSMEGAQLALREFLDEDGNWRPMETS